MRFQVSWFACGAVLLSLCTHGGCKRPNETAAVKSRASESHAPTAAEHTQPTATVPQRLDVKHLPNAIKLHERVISGGQPDGEAAFVELRDLGIKTVVSVDGVKPDVALAEKYGMRYVHLPHGYNGISESRATELAKAVRDFKGPIYIHCHHGKHRSPAAATVACVANGLLDPQAATSILAFAGTSENYQGLYKSAASARRIDDAILDAVQDDFPTVAKLPPMAEAMVQLDHTFDHLKRIAATGWQPLADHPDLDAAHEALLLSEHFAEMLRLDSVASEPDAFREMLKQSMTDAQQLQSSLRARATGNVATEDLNQPFKRLSENCTKCHRQFRDVPL